MQQFDTTFDVACHGAGDAIGERAQCFGFDPHDIFSDVLHGSKNVSFRSIEFIVPALPTPFRVS